MTIRLKAVLQAILLLTLATVLVAQEGAKRSTRDGVYTKDQAQRGKASFDDACGRCHQADNFKGNYLDGWAGNTVGGLYDSIVSTMPENRPGSLKPEIYADILAYLFEVNELPSGADELPGDSAALAKIMIERRPK